MTEAEVRQLSCILLQTDEILPYLLLRRRGFSACGQMQGALAESLARAPAAPSTRRPKGGPSLVQKREAQVDVQAALQAFILRDINDGEMTERLDVANRRLASQSPGSPLDAHRRIRS